MNIKKLIAAVAVFAAAGSVFANDLMPFSELDNFKSSKSRTEVKAEVLHSDRAESVSAHGDLIPNDQIPFFVENTRVRQDANGSARHHAVAPSERTGS